MPSHGPSSVRGVGLRRSCPGTFRQTVIATLPRTSAVLEQPHGVGRLVERVGAVEARDDLAGLDEVGEPFVGRWRAPWRRGARGAAAGRARCSAPRSCLPMPVMVAAVLATDEHGGPSGSEGSPQPPQRTGAGDVEDQVVAAGAVAGEVLGRVVDDPVRAGHPGRRSSWRGRTRRSPRPRTTPPAVRRTVPTPPDAPLTQGDPLPGLDPALVGAGPCNAVSAATGIAAAWANDTFGRLVYGPAPRRCAERIRRRAPSRMPYTSSPIGEPGDRRRRLSATVPATSRPGTGFFGLSDAERRARMA